MFVTFVLAKYLVTGKLFQVEFLRETEYRLIDKVGMPHVLNFITAKLAAYDTKRLDWIKLLPLNHKALLHGACDFPYRKDPLNYYFISVGEMGIMTTQHHLQLDVSTSAVRR